MTWIERVKTISLILLVISSIVLTGVLWYSTPAYQEDRNQDTYAQAPYIAKDNYVKKNLYTLTAPPFLISHKKGNHQLVLQQSAMFNTLIHDVYKIGFDNFEEISPTADQWNMLYHQADGLELSFFHDMNPEQLDIFFYQLLSNDSTFQTLPSISRVWLYEDPNTGKSNIWFISDEDNKVIQATTNLTAFSLSKSLTKINSNISLEPVPTNGKNPWERSNQGNMFSRMLYLPTKSIAMSQFTYSVKHISIDDMKEWLFQGANIEPIELPKNESVYMDNNQILTYYKQDSYMVYTDSTRGDESPTPISTELDLMNTKFMDKHHGWTGNFVLEEWEKSNGSDNYSFRLMEQSLPVFWGKSTKPQLDSIQLQFGSGISSVSRYQRSLLYLAKQPFMHVGSLLDDKTTLLTKLTKEHIDLASVKRIYPIYRASRTRDDVTLTPCWLVEQTNGQTLQIGGES